MPVPHGVLPVLQTPFFADESIDVATLGEEIDVVLGQGAHGIVLALASELLRLSPGERAELTTFLCAHAAGRCPVIISVGAETTRQATVYARQAAAAGASVLMATPPLCTAATESELARYYDALIDATALPVIVQDASAFVGKPLSIGFQTALIARHGPERVAFKPESAPVGPVISALRQAGGPSLGIYEGAGGAQLTANFDRGLTGTIPGSEMVDAIVALWRALASGDRERAYRIGPLVGALNAIGVGLDGYLAVEKRLLLRRGVFQNDIIRGPVAFRLDDVACAEADRLFDRLLGEVGRHS